MASTNFRFPGQGSSCSQSFFLKYNYQFPWCISLLLGLPQLSNNTIFLIMLGLEVRDQGVSTVGLSLVSSPRLVNVYLPLVPSHCLPCVCLGPDLFFLYGHQAYWIKPTPTASFKLNYLFKDAVSKHSHILKYWRLGLQYMNLRGTQFSP